MSLFFKNDEMKRFTCCQKHEKKIYKERENFMGKFFGDCHRLSFYNKLQIANSMLYITCTRYFRHVRGCKLAILFT